MKHCSPAFSWSAAARARSVPGATDTRGRSITSRKLPPPRVVARASRPRRPGSAGRRSGSGRKARARKAWARRERDEEQVLGIVERGVSPEHRIGAPEEVGLARSNRLKLEEMAEPEAPRIRAAASASVPPASPTPPETPKGPELHGQSRATPTPSTCRGDRIRTCDPLVPKHGRTLPWSPPASKPLLSFSLLRASPTHLHGLDASGRSAV
jgi:hypothetical protein